MKHALPVLRPGTRGYPLKIGQIVWHGSSEPRRRLADCSFVAVRMSTARMFAKDRTTQELGWISRYEITRLPTLLEFEWHSQLLNTFRDNPFAQKLKEAGLLIGNEGAFGWRAHVANRLKALAPRGIDGWFQENWEVFLLRPMQFLTFVSCIPRRR